MGLVTQPIQFAKVSPRRGGCPQGDPPKNIPKHQPAKHIWMISSGRFTSDGTPIGFRLTQVKFQPGTLALFCPMLEHRAATAKKFS